MMRGALGPTASSDSKCPRTNPIGRMYRFLKWHVPAVQRIRSISGGDDVQQINFGFCWSLKKSIDVDFYEFLKIFTDFHFIGFLKIFTDFHFIGF